MSSFLAVSLHLEDAGAHPRCGILAVHVSPARRDGWGRTGEGLVGDGSLRQQVAAGIGVFARHRGRPVLCRSDGNEAERKGLLVDASEGLVNMRHAEGREDGVGCMFVRD